MQKTYYEFRQLESTNELKQFLLLRYSIYRESRLAMFSPENDLGIDLDCYDVNSVHFGLFEHSDGISRPVGYIRMITDQRGPFANEIISIASESQELYRKVTDTPAEPFPIISYCPDGQVIKEFCEKVQSSGKKVVEASRFSLDKSIRGHKMADHFLTAISASFIVHDVEFSLMTCHLLHKSFYSGFGFRQVEGTVDYYTELYNYRFFCLTGSAEYLPDAVKDRVLQMAEAYDTTGRICYYPNNPEQFYAPLDSFIESRPIFMAA
ncbi:MAG: GNAT family N-acetyltransferase [Ignavibacteriales bacterium]|nr:GNAT family N-acetyltransferase [Ignavibacteriales bacterium]